MQKRLTPLPGQDLPGEDVPVEVIVLFQAVNGDFQVFSENVSIRGHRNVMFLSEVIEQNHNEFQPALFDRPDTQERVVQRPQTIGGHEDDGPTESLRKVCKSLLHRYGNLPAAHSLHEEMVVPGSN